MAKKENSTEVTAFKHQDKRVNIPPQELSGFMADDERAPKTTLYPRDPALDPQLVWKGKDEQDRSDLAVPSVPIYIQEKIQPQAIVENVRDQAARFKGTGEDTAEYLQMNFFDDFNHIEFEDLVEFYEHEQNWSNRMILGDSLLVMNSLAQREALKGKVQMIYMDPPYGIKFGSNWQTRLRKREVKDGSQADLTREPEQVKAFRDTWELGIHSYLSYLRDRFIVARDLLSESGSIFVQIGDENVHLVRSLLDEVFGSENYITTIVFKKASSATSNFLATTSDFILWVSKNIQNAKYRRMYLPKLGDDSSGFTTYRNVELEDGSTRSLSKDEVTFQNYPAGSKPYRLDPLISQSGGDNSRFPVSINGRRYQITKDFWKTNILGMNRLIQVGRVQPLQQVIRYKRYIDDFAVYELNHSWNDLLGAMNKIYVVETNQKVIERCMLMTTDPGDLVLDPTCGSGTTAYVAEQWGRRWITIDTSRVSLALARMRLMSASFPYYLLADSPEGYQKENELSSIPQEGFTARKAHFGYDLRHGFVYERVPHITLKAIANNEEIDQIYERWQQTLEPLRAQINSELGKAYEEWEMPQEAQGTVGKLLKEWWQGKRSRQAEFDASIARRADTELLYDKPYEDRKRVRVSGPFTVESLSPHRVLSSAAERPESEKLAERLEGGGKFEQMILENLRTSGVQNTRKSERLNFIRLESYAGSYLQASGEYQAGTGSKRVAVCIGPEHGTVTADLIREAAKEAMQGIGFDLLVVLGFAFDPHVSEEVKQYGRLKVFPARINPDLMMGDLLKKTRNANLFTAYGEPDVELVKQEEKLVVKLKGVDIFDPTTGEIRSSKPDEIACWFIDDDYNDESFFVRQAYFTGWDDPYNKLKRALKAEIDPDAWQSLYREQSVAFERPKGGKIAVKVINDYGDEVLKVIQV
ncbi:MAG: site-specific DNA-methyltransferase [Anaerolineaceae bacterium]